MGVCDKGETWCHFEPGPCLYRLRLSALWELGVSAKGGRGAAASRGPSGHYAHEGSAPS